MLNRLEEEPAIRLGGRQPIAGSPAHLCYLVSDLALIPALTTRDLLHREAVLAQTGADADSGYERRT